MSAWLSPALLLGALLSIAYASLYHLWMGRSLRELIVALLAAAIGFATGQSIGILTMASLLEIGQLHVLEGSICAWLALLVLHLFHHTGVGERS
jgi:hypothetical protein